MYVPFTLPVKKWHLQHLASPREMISRAVNMTGSDRQLDLYILYGTSICIQSTLMMLKILRRLIIALVSVDDAHNPPHADIK